MDTDPAYREVQRFRQWWIWTLLTSIALLMLVLGPVSVIGLALVGAIAAFVYSIRLTTEVRNDGIYVKMWPLHQSFRRVSWSEIERYEAKTYDPIREFGGWGIRWTPGKIAYNVSGNRGVWIQRTNGRDILIGTQHVEKFVTAIDEVYER
ncbi:hypothetical protein SAMN05421858_4866 [Haladaptatus litoreus]|uniref:Uncharacterized protein n=2 Tax=Haladaptatus litoreus TaxID=553468 RepID=A0A1N7FA74_9EURY|nr:hypothetical protein SAMN05421858_4866 [Haladaptatus litoreus]